MLARLSLTLDTALDFRQTSLLHGVIMERIDSDYAAYLHGAQLHPYSQCIVPQGNGDSGKSKWIIQTVNVEACDNIIQKIVAGEDSFVLKKFSPKLVKILERRVEKFAKSALVQDFYNAPANNKFRIRFLTPTAFRHRGRYVILPDMRLMCQSLMMKYSAASDALDMTDEDTLAQIAAETFVTRHHLRSVIFPAEGQNIPGFVGDITFASRGTETMARYLRLLFSFGEFTGIGIKTAMGMGAIKFIS